MKLFANNREYVFEAVEHPNIMKALQYLEISNHDKVLVIAGRFFSSTADEANKLDRSGLRMEVVLEKDDIGGDLIRIVTIPINKEGEVPTVDDGLPVTNGDGVM